MEGGRESDGMTSTASDGPAFVSDNISFNSSSISTYSAEEEIIQQRGRRSPKKKSLDDDHQSLQHLDINQYYHLPLAQYSDPIQTSCAPSCSEQRVWKKSERNLGRSLLRTPVKRRLRFMHDSTTKLPVKRIRKFQRRNQKADICNPSC